MPLYSVSVALFDYLPVLVAAWGLAYLAGAIATTDRRLRFAAWAAALLIVSGGLCKASWKLHVALTGESLNWLENLLFILLAPGFLMLAFSLQQASLRWRRPLGLSGSIPWRWPTLLLGLVAAGGVTAAALVPDTRLWFFWLLAVTAAANIALIIQAILLSRALNLRASVTALFLYSIIATLALSGLTRLTQSEWTAWIQQSVNLTAQGSLALGLWLLSRRMRATKD